MSAPLIVVEGSAAAFARAVREIEVLGWRVVQGFDPRLPTHGGTGFVHAGTVASAADAARAVLTALDGSGVIVAASAPTEIVDRLVDDLRRLGPVDHRIGEPSPEVELDPASREILGLLAEGHSLGEAAAILGLARRTADRRLAGARRALGVERTTEAIARARRLGWLGRRGAG
jgi:DNA-binding CsgD family transcriptional regulator